MGYAELKEAAGKAVKGLFREPEQSMALLEAVLTALIGRVEALENKLAGKADKAEKKGAKEEAEKQEESSNAAEPAKKTNKAK